MLIETETQRDKQTGRQKGRELGDLAPVSGQYAPQIPGLLPKELK